LNLSALFNLFNHDSKLFAEQTGPSLGVFFAGGGFISGCRAAGTGGQSGAGILSADAGAADLPGEQRDR
jgi:hypothetical protein